MMTWACSVRARTSLELLRLSLAVDAVGGDDPSDEALLSNLLATCHAVAVLTVIDLLESLLDLPNVDPLSVSDSQLEVTVGLHGGNVERVCKRLFVVCKVPESLSCLLQEAFETLLEEILKKSRRSVSINLLAWGYLVWLAWSEETKSPCSDESRVLLSHLIYPGN